MDQVLAGQAAHAESADAVHAVRRAWPAGQLAEHAVQGAVPVADHEPAAQGVERAHTPVAEFHEKPAAQAQPLWPVAKLPLL